LVCPTLARILLSMMPRQAPHDDRAEPTLLPTVSREITTDAMDFFDVVIGTHRDVTLRFPSREET